MITTCGKSRKKNFDIASVLGVSRGDFDVIEAYLETLAAENMAPRTIRLHAYYLKRLALRGGGAISDADQPD